MPTVEFTVRGETKVASINSSYVDKWRKAVGTVALATRREAMYKQPKKGTIFTVQINFYLDNRQLLQCDLDNLAKPVLDTLFCCLATPNKESVVENTLFDIGDNSVQKLSLEKYLAGSSTEYGADIKVFWE